MTTNSLRQLYLDFFQKQDHAILPSASLLPENDPTTLFTGSGMQPMVPYLLGEKHPLGSRLADSQKCFRAQDIEEVGDNRHTTFFEMLGNWSLGDYFKKEQITWMFTFLVDSLQLDPNRLYFTCFRGSDELGIPRDEEAAGLWQSLLKERGVSAEIADLSEERGLQGARIFYYPEKKNWWSRSGVPQKMPMGEPGGPDTEMFWDFNPKRGDKHRQDGDEAVYGEFCHVNCDCGRFMEVGNNVFMEYKKTEKGFEKLSQQNVDFGGGLERLMAAKIDNPDVFMIDIFSSPMSQLERISGRRYAENEKETYAFRVILDHLRAAIFVIADGALPSNKDQGYFTRRLIRRSVRFAKVLGIEENFTTSIAEGFLENYKEAYPEVYSKKDLIFVELEKEEVKFRKTLSAGLKEFSRLANGLEKGQQLSTEGVFDLYQSYGFPLELTEELAKENNLKIDLEAFELEKKKHQEMSRQGAEKKFKGGLSDHSDMSVKYHTATHLLHVALRSVLGDHVGQKGSNITPERLRFDFSHQTKMTDDELKKVEELVNLAIARDYAVSFAEMPVEEAYKQSVIGVFPERYDQVIKVYTVGDPNFPGRANPSDPTFSREICGGPHVEHTGVLGKFKIVKEEAVSTGVRRIKAILE